MPRPVCIITGATSGIGRCAAFRLAALEVDLVLVGRNVRAGSTMAARLKRRPGHRVEFVPADLSRQCEVRRLADHIQATGDHVDILINNAGARYDTYSETEDGIERTFATNHLGHFLLTNLLAPHLLRARAARVVTVSSASHYGVTAADGWYFGRDAYDRRAAYARSKLANTMFAFELPRRFRGTSLTSNAVDPGGVFSNFARNNGVIPWTRHLIAHALKRDLVLPGTAAGTLVWTAASSELAGVTGKLFRRCCEVDPSPYSRDEVEASRLWDLSAALTHLPLTSLAV